MAEIARRRENFGWPEIMDWFERGMPAMFRGEAPLAWPGGSTVRVEDYVEDNAYVLRAELPGIDPDKDVEVTVADGVLTVRAERREERKDKRHSEFHYGAFQRSITLPPNAKEDDVTATYADGILTVRVALGETPEPAPKRITVQKG